MTAESRRADRVAEAIKSELASTLLRELSDPRLTSLVVTHVDVAPDLSSAKIGVRLLSGDESETNRRAALKSLARAGNRIRRALAPRLGLRRFPELLFSYDTGHDATRRVEELLAEIGRDNAGRGPDPDPDPDPDPNPGLDLDPDPDPDPES